MPSAVPQPVAAKLTRAAIFLAVTIKPDPEYDAVVRSLCADVAALVASQPLVFWAHKFEAADACVTPVLTIDEAQAHPLFAGQASVQAWQQVA